MKKRHIYYSHQELWTLYMNLLRVNGLIQASRGIDGRYCLKVDSHLPAKIPTNDSACHSFAYPDERAKCWWTVSNNYGYSRAHDPNLLRIKLTECWYPLRWLQSRNCWSDATEDIMFTAALTLKSTNQSQSIHIWTFSTLAANPVEDAVNLSNGISAIPFCK